MKLRELLLLVNDVTECTNAHNVVLKHKDLGTIEIGSPCWVKYCIAGGTIDRGSYSYIHDFIREHRQLMSMDAKGWVLTPKALQEIESKYEKAGSLIAKLKRLQKKECGE